MNAVGSGGVGYGYATTRNGPSQNTPLRLRPPQNDVPKLAVPTRHQATCLPQPGLAGSNDVPTLSQPYRRRSTKQNLSVLTRPDGTYPAWSSRFGPTERNPTRRRNGTHLYAPSAT